MVKFIRIDHALWDEASAMRRHDWRVSIADLIDDARLGGEDDHLMHLSQGDTALGIALFDEGGGPTGVHEVAYRALRAHVDEYVAIIHKMHEGDANDASSRMYALDMAKKVVHDAGAKTLAGELPGLARDHETYRRLFSLLLAILIDVTALPGVRSHRRHT